jgi:hypothetical protein
MDGVLQLLGNGGILPTSFVDSKGRNISPRSLGLRHGVMSMLLALLIVPITAILSVSAGFHPKMLIPLTALIFFGGGLLRIIYALLFEEDIQRVKPPPPSSYNPPMMPSQSGAMPRGQAALPPQQSTPVSGWRQRTDTAELVRPQSSVTENTTRLLDDKVDPNAH